MADLFKVTYWAKKENTMTKTYYAYISMTLIGAFIIAALYSCGYINKALGLQDDNAIEEGLESVIQDRTGIDVDLTPENLGVGEKPAINQALPTPGVQEAKEAPMPQKVQTAEVDQTSGSVSTTSSGQ